MEEELLFQGSEQKRQLGDNKKRVAFEKNALIAPCEVDSNQTVSERSNLDGKRVHREHLTHSIKHGENTDSTHHEVVLTKLFSLTQIKVDRKSVSENC